MPPLCAPLCVRDRHSGGNRRATTAQETRAIINYAKEKRFVTAAEIKQGLHLECSTEKIRRHFLLSILAIIKNSIYIGIALICK